ncbi:MAG: ATP synthase F1 subunit gamma [Candidatus Terrybacteria bacterium RIFCSPHIGHO2_01_FULL_58_15]|uniref:ATP synthase gamma chain n=1 Tax=Terrybacteria sp. (strain RIFCSPHIGHO2_01_FULL_58_15) TaxID=1802363 RepID=A0A1G2PLJ6_TERXR|nr:MAG: ATP synthase F1 subunit gamma [Candidatus Terrybacteria bacterium RIFCSPHIGHO2_01_FULL_58_15]
MPVNTRELRRRIRATKSVKQITKAMEMIAASKMRKAQLAALASRPYAHLAWEMLVALGASIARSGSENAAVHPLLREGAAEGPRLVLVLTPNRGLCGSLSAQVLSEARMGRGSEVHYVSVGKKGQRALARLKLPVVAHFNGFETQPAVAEVRPIAKMLMDAFIAEEVVAVDVVYADFISTLQYRVRRQALLPLRIADGLQQATTPEFLFEPSPAAALQELMPRLTELLVYQAILEGLASEHSARMVAMQGASRAADDLIDDFTLTYNAARQAAITGELADIVGGRLAVAL